jgi:hypothetical protein
MMNIVFSMSMVQAEGVEEVNKVLVEEVVETEVVGLTRWTSQRMWK